MNYKRTIILTIAIIMGITLVPTIYKIHENHNDKLLLVVKEEFHYYAKKCYLEDKCSNVVTLKDLYDKGYLKEKLTNPITKKYYNENSSIHLDTNEINLIS